MLLTDSSRPMGLKSQLMASWHAEKVRRAKRPKISAVGRVSPSPEKKNAAHSKQPFPQVWKVNKSDSRHARETTCSSTKIGWWLKSCRADSQLYQNCGSHILWWNPLDYTVVAQDRKIISSFLRYVSTEMTKVVDGVRFFSGPMVFFFPVLLIRPIYTVRCQNCRNGYLLLRGHFPPINAKEVQSCQEVLTGH